MVVNILKYESDNLIILYHYTYSRLLGTIEIVIQNFIGLTRSVKFVLQLKSQSVKIKEESCIGLT